MVLAGLPPEVPDRPQPGQQVPAHPSLPGSGFGQQLFLPQPESLDQQRSPCGHGHPVDVPLQLGEGELALWPGHLDG